MSINITIILLVLITVISFIAGYLFKKNNTLEDAENAIISSEDEDENRDSVIKKAEKQIDKNKEAIENAKNILNSTSSTDK